MSVKVPRELLDRYNKPGPRYTSYPTVPVWSADFGEADYRAALGRLAGAPDDELSLYMHLPYCMKRCHYCGCNSEVTHDPADFDSYLDRVEKEVGTVVAAAGKGRRAVQVHWGGGTPNYMRPQQLERAFGILADAFDIDPDGEISIECDPRLGTPEQMALLRKIGFNRVSMGVQDFHKPVQKAIGRVQSERRTVELYRACRDLDFQSVNLDLVFGLPLQNSETFARTLETVIGLGPDRVACFSYAHVPWVKANQKNIDETLLPDAHAKFDLFQQAIDTFAAAGYDWVGMDHFAKRDDELAVALRERRLHRNFMGYTTRPAPHMLAFGSSSIGEVADSFVQNSAGIADYLAGIDAGGLPVVRGHRLGPDDRLRRAAILHLMCNLELPFAMEVDGSRVDAALAAEIERLAPFAAEGFVEIDSERVNVTGLGRFFIRNICMEFDAYLDRSGDKPLFSKTI